MNYNGLVPWRTFISISHLVEIEGCSNFGSSQSRTLPKLHLCPLQGLSAAYQDRYRRSREEYGALTSGD